MLIACLLSSVVSLAAAGWQEGREIAYPGILGVELNSGPLPVEIGPSGTGTVVFELDGVSDRIRVFHEAAEALLRIRIERDPSASALRVEPGTVRLLVPEGAWIRVHSGEGAVVASDVRGRKLTVNSRTGGVTIENCEADFDIQTTSGSITMRRSPGDKLLRTGEGSILVEDSEGRIESSASLGRQRFVGVDGRIYANGATGDISLERVRGAYRLFSSDGSILGQDVALVDDSQFRSNTGNIRLALSNAPTDVRFDLQTVLGTIRVGDREVDAGPLELRPRGAEITVWGSSTAGTQIYTFGETVPGGMIPGEDAFPGM